MSSPKSPRRPTKPQPSSTSPQAPTQLPPLATSSHTDEPQNPPTIVSPALSSPTSRKRKAAASDITTEAPKMPSTEYGDPGGSAGTSASAGEPSLSPTAKKSRTNTPWTPAEERRLKSMRDAGNTWNEIAKTFPTRTEGSVKKHWYKDMHYADFAEDESAALLAAIKEYEASKWKVIGQKVGKPAKACEQYAKEHFGGKG